MDNAKVAAGMRKLAAELRTEHAKVEERKMQKCAQVLIAARGLYQLDRMVRGAEHDVQ